MKKNFLLIVCAIALVFNLCSCGGGPIKPVSEKIQGPLGDYFQVVSKDYKEKDGKISVEIKRVKEGFPAPWEEGMEVGYGDGDFEPLFSIELQDADGIVVSKDQSDIVWDDDDLKAVAALGVDESTSITFGGYLNFDGVTQFKVGSTFEVHPEKETSSSSYSSSSSSSSSSSLSSSDYDYDEEDIDKAIDAAQKSLELTKDAMDIYKSMGN